MRHPWVTLNLNSSLNLLGVFVTRRSQAQGQGCLAQGSPWTCGPGLYAGGPAPTIAPPSEWGCSGDTRTGFRGTKIPALPARW